MSLWSALAVSSLLLIIYLVARRGEPPAGKCSAVGYVQVFISGQGLASYVGFERRDHSRSMAQNCLRYPLRSCAASYGRINKDAGQPHLSVEPILKSLIAQRHRLNSDYPCTVAVGNAQRFNMLLVRLPDHHRSVHARQSIGNGLRSPLRSFSPCIFTISLPLPLCRNDSEPARYSAPYDCSADANQRGPDPVKVCSNVLNHRMLQHSTRC